MEVKQMNDSFFVKMRGIISFMMQVRVLCQKHLVCLMM